MAGKGQESKAEKRANRAVGLADALGATLGPALKKRGFASRDLVAHWPAIAPAPYDRVAAPDQLKWPRGERGADGAVLLVRCADSHRLALQHEGAKVAAAINRYFGYLLVAEVRLSATPFSAGSAAERKAAPQPDAADSARVEASLARVADPGLRDALRRLGLGLMGRRR